MTRVRYIIAAVVVTLASTLTACGGLRSDRPSEQVYVLQVADGEAAAQPVPAVLRVIRPQVQPGLDTPRIAVTRPGNEMDYIASSRWGAPLSRVLEAFLVESLTRAGTFQVTVGTQPGAVQGNFELLLTARHFEARYSEGNEVPTAHVAFDCVLTTVAPRRVLGRCDAEAQQQAAANRVGAIVQALEQAAQQATRALSTSAAQLAAAELRK